MYVEQVRQNASINILNSNSKHSKRYFNLTLRINRTQPVKKNLHMGKRTPSALAFFFL